MEKERKFRKWLYFLSIGVALIIIYKILGNFNNIGSWFSHLIRLLMPFLIGMLIAYILYIPAKKIEECYRKTKFKILKKRARGFSIFTIYLIVAIILFILVNVILPPIKSSVADLVGNLPGYYSTLRTVIHAGECIRFHSQTANSCISFPTITDYSLSDNIQEYLPFSHRDKLLFLHTTWFQRRPLNQVQY